MEANLNAILMIYLSPFAPVPLWTSELVTVSNIDRLRWLITVVIINKLIIHWLWINATYTSNLLAAFFTTGHRAIAPATGSPFVLGHGRSRFDIDCVVIKYWRTVIIIIIVVAVAIAVGGEVSRLCISVSGCGINIGVRCLLNLIKETTPYRQEL